MVHNLEGSQGMTSEQAQKVDGLRSAVASYLQEGQLRWFCTDSCLIRYLRARNWKLSDATKMLKHTLEWRLKYKPHAITWQDIAVEAETGKQFIMTTRDKTGRPVVVLRARNENTKGAERQIKFLVYTLEAACRIADEEGSGQMCWLIDFVGYTLRTAPSISVAIQTMSILQNHYPERLGQAVCYRPPKVFQITWKAVQSFIDPVTFKKIVFVMNDAEMGKMDAIFDLNELELCMGGRSSFEYNWAEYGLEMERLDSERHGQLQKFR